MEIASTLEEKTLNYITRSLQTVSQEIHIPCLLSQEKLQELLQRELSSNPRWFYVTDFKVMYRPMAAVIYPNYSYGALEAARLSERCQRTAEQLVSRVQSGSMYSKILRIHDLLAKNVLYMGGFDRELHTIVGPLTKKRGVCDGFAKTLKYLLDMMQIPCQLVFGSGSDPLTGTEERHAWNMVQIDGCWLHVDVTFDTTVRSGDILRYDYFCLSSEQILQDHSYPIDEYPAADRADYGFYSRQNLVMDSREKMKAHLLSGLHSGVTDYVFQLPFSTREAGLEKKVASEVESLLVQNGLAYSYIIHYNLQQRVFHIHIQI